MRTFLLITVHFLPALLASGCIDGSASPLVADAEPLHAVRFAPGADCLPRFGDVVGVEPRALEVLHAAPTGSTGDPIADGDVLPVFQVGAEAIAQVGLAMEATASFECWKVSASAPGADDPQRIEPASQSLAQSGIAGPVNLVLGADAAALDGHDAEIELHAQTIDGLEATQALRVHLRAATE